MAIVSEIVEGSSSSSSSDYHKYKYDVFLSFQGRDTRNRFTDHLHKALIGANISTILVDEEIETRGDLKPELENAIKESRASIIVLSKNYANSSWCLDELVLILEQRITHNHIVLPIFYNVEPTHVRKQQKSFGDSIVMHKHAMEAETNSYKRSHMAQKIDGWIKALKEVAELKGMDANGRLESEVIEEVVEYIYRRLRISSRIPLPQLIGMDYSKHFVTSWLTDTSSDTYDILTILGMGGIGKTSLAKYVYALHFHEFETSSFIEDISRRCADKFNTSSFSKDITPSSENFSGLLDLQKQQHDDIQNPSSVVVDAASIHTSIEKEVASHGLLDIQKQLYYDITKRSPIQVLDVLRYTSEIENLVARKKVFLVLDDIDSHDQLYALLGRKGFHPGSKIIITTKDAYLTESYALFRKSTKSKHILQGLHETDSRKLLCFHAFISNDPKAGYEGVLEELVKYCEGHPLALEILGKSLYNQDVAYWEDCIKALKKQKDLHISSVLRKNFDSLPSKNDKELFKHVACFFVGMDIAVTETILHACGIDTFYGIRNLINRHLLSIGQNNKLQMHQLFQQMGRSVVRQESHYKPYMQSLLFCHEESFKVLKHKTGTESVLGLTLDMKKLEEENLHGSFVLKTDALSKMGNLMLLQLNYVKINGDYKNFPKKLRWLCMHGFRKKFIPPNLPMENLVALDMSYSKIESFERSWRRQKLPRWFPKDKRLIRSLKILNLSYCDQLHSLGGFDGLPALERLIATNCGGLVEVSKSIKECGRLVLIDLSNCEKLKKLPRNIGMLKKVETLLLEGCNLGESRVKNIGVMDTPEKLKAVNIGINRKLKAVSIGINRKPSSSIIITMQSDLEYFRHVLPRSLLSLSLVDNNLFDRSFPRDLSFLSMLKELYLDGNPIVSMPSCVRTLPRLERLSMSNCKMLTSVERPPRTLRELILHFDSKPLLRKVVFDREMSPLKLSFDLRLFIPSSFEIEGIVKIQPMADVEEKVLLSLGWTNLDFLHGRRLQTDSSVRGSEESEIQMYYEFGIYSTIYGGVKMPKWIKDRSKWHSISFTIPSSPNNLIGLNFCFLQAFVSLQKFFELPVITIKNITKNHTWLYKHCVGVVSVSGYSIILLSHWMFGNNEMEVGDHVSITVMMDPGFTRECGVSLVYDDVKSVEEENVLDYYKSWNHIIGGDLSAFQLTTGEYILHSWRFMQICNEIEFSRQFIKCGIADSASFKEEEVSFRAFSQRKSNILDHALEIDIENVTILESLQDEKRLTQQENS
ncbi:hypothetical protein Lser_V15G02979 [Lactuca serriola]